eukprot:7109515-Alexandrium_andersonii.AAC.1
MPGFSNTGAPSRRAPAVGPTHRPVLQPKALSPAAPSSARARARARRPRHRAKPPWATRPSQPRPEDKEASLQAAPAY